MWYMNIQADITVDAPAARVWEVFADPTHWPEWTPSVTTVEALDGPTLELGHRFKIKQPRLPALVWTVTAVDAPRSWTWVARTPGARTAATHVVAPQGDASSTVTQVIEHHGVLGTIAGLVTRRQTRRYLAMEGNGLKAASEEHPVAPQS
jgi:uncharacterized protein YndB with AHSA1/START domain